MATQCSDPARRFRQRSVPELNEKSDEWAVSYDTHEYHSITDTTGLAATYKCRSGSIRTGISAAAVVDLQVAWVGRGLNVRTSINIVQNACIQGPLKGEVVLGDPDVYLYDGE